MILKFAPKTAGGHVHIKVWTASAPDRTFEGSGELVMRVGEEWTAFKAFLVNMAGGDERPDGSIIIDAEAP